MTDFTLETWEKKEVYDNQTCYFCDYLFSSRGLDTRNDISTRQKSINNGPVDRGGRSRNTDNNSISFSNVPASFIAYGCDTKNIMELYCQTHKDID